MGLRAIPAQRLLASHPSTGRANFFFGDPALGDDVQTVDAILVFSPCMFLPAVIARAEALALFQYGSSEMLGVKRAANDLGFLGVEADVKAIDGSPGGMLRAMLMSYASEQVFNLMGAIDAGGGSRLVDLSQIRAYYLGEGLQALRGERTDVLTADLTNYTWNQP